MQYFPVSDNMLDMTVPSASLLPKPGEMNPMSESQAGVSYSVYSITILRLRK